MFYLTCCREKTFTMKRCILLLCIVAVFRHSEALRKGSTDYEGVFYINNRHIVK